MFATARAEVALNTDGKGSDEPVILENKAIKVEIHPGKGGRILHFLDKKTGVSYAGPGGMLRDCISTMYPGTGDTPYQYKIEIKRPEKTVLKMWHSTAWGIEMEKTVTIENGPYIEVTLRMKRDKEAGYISYRAHNEISGRSDNGKGDKVYYFPQGTGIRSMPVITGMDKDCYLPGISGNWYALLNRRYGDGIVAVMQEKPVEFISWIIGYNGSNMEWSYKPRSLAKDEVWETKYLLLVGKRQEIYRTLTKKTEYEVDKRLAGVLLGKMLPGIEKETIKADHKVTAAEKKQGYIAFPINPMELILPNRLPRERETGRSLSIFLAPGEYEPASFVIHALQDLNKVRVQVSDLRSGNNIISAASVDPYVVKCWYNPSHVRLAEKGERILMPGLLLKDDGLIKVDDKNRDNYIKAAIDGEERYFCISKADNKGLEEYLRPIIKGSKVLDLLLPIRDAETLAPFDIPGKTAKQVWFTVRVPEDTPAGIYKGFITIEPGNAPLIKMPFSLEVLPIKLEKPCLDYGIFYTGSLDLKSEGTMTMLVKSEVQFRREMENMAAHGVLAPTVYQSLSDRTSSSRLLEIRREAGMAEQPFLFVGGSTRADKTFFSRTAAFLEGYGVRNVFFWSADESAGKGLQSDVPSMQKVREVGGKSFATIMFGCYDIVGNSKVPDLLIMSGPTAWYADEVHAYGGKVYCYANPQANKCDPLAYRKNYGFQLYKAGFDGGATWAYQCNRGNIWNDFDGFEESFTYPTTNGLINTLGWEGFREGVDDVRYLTTLIKTIKQAEKSADKKSLADEAGKFLAKLLDKNCEVEDSQQLRYQIAGWIVRLQE